MGRLPAPTHVCVGAGGWIVCIEEEEGMLLIVENDASSFEACRFCPFCGKPANSSPEEPAVGLAS